MKKNDSMCNPFLKSCQIEKIILGSRMLPGWRKKIVRGLMFYRCHDIFVFQVVLSLLRMGKIFLQGLQKRFFSLSSSSITIQSREKVEQFGLL
jgi:hypothetical protein